MPQDMALLDVRKIWDRSPHNALTDLIRFRDRWFCVFREGLDHASPGGQLRILSSCDGTAWDNIGVLADPSADLRDPKLSITPAGDLMLIAAAALHPPAEFRHQTLAWHSCDGRSWNGPFKIGEPNFWLWRVTWFRDVAYGIGYSTINPAGEIRLYSSRDGRRFDVLSCDLFQGGYPNESTIAFLPDGTALCLLRRDAQPATAQLGMSRPPYHDWQWSDLGVRIGGPHLILLPDGHLLAGVRRYAPGRAWTSLNWLHPTEGRLEEFAALPSGGDTSYTGLVWQDPMLWVSYYSSHEGRTSVYLATLRIKS
jgi:hypothetical protein